MTTERSTHKAETVTADDLGGEVVESEELDVKKLLKVAYEPADQEGKDERDTGVKVIVDPRRTGNRK